MELTWVALAASLIMALAALCIFIFAVKKDYFRNIEDIKYQVFWSDLEEHGPKTEKKHVHSPQAGPR